MHASSEAVARQPPKSPNRVLAEAEAQWIFTDAELANTPSIQDGLSVAEERDLRAKGVNFIMQCGIMLKIPQLTLSTAIIFFQRYLMRGSMRAARDGIPKLHHFQAAATALFLATKVEESCRKMKDLVIAFCRVAQKNPNKVIDEQSKDYWKWRDCVLYNEDVLLEVLCFDLTVESPHRALFDMMKYHGLEHNKRLRNAAWAYLTDSSNTQLCLLQNNRTIVVSSLYVACKFHNVSLPDAPHSRPWWEAHQVRLKDISKCILYMQAVYEQSAGKSGGEGNNSAYVQGLATPEAMSGDGWDSTRKPDLLSPPERPGSATSSAGVKREREEDGSNEDGRSERKRARSGEHSEANGHTNGGSATADSDEARRPESQQSNGVHGHENGYSQGLTNGLTNGHSAPAEDPDTKATTSEEGDEANGHANDPGATIDIHEAADVAREEVNGANGHARSQSLPPEEGSEEGEVEE